MFSQQISQLIKEAFTYLLAEQLTNLINIVFGEIITGVLSASDVNYYINTDLYLPFIQVLAGLLLIVTITWEVFKQTGQVFRGEEKSFETLVIQTVWAGAFIYILPKSITTIFLPLNNALVQWLGSVGVTVTPDAFRSSLSGMYDSHNYLTVPLFFFLSLGAAFVVLGILAGIRNIELAIVMLIAPITAVSLVNRGEAIQVWVRETTAIVFTQVIHVFLLSLLFQICNSQSSIMRPILCFSSIYVMIKGPQILRKFLYSTGLGSVSVRSIGSAGRLAAMRIMLKG